MPAPGAQGLVLEDVSRTVIGAFFEVYNKLRFGFLESVYCRALEHELRAAGLRVMQEVPIEVYYKQVEVGHYRVDLLVENTVIVEVKACARIDMSARRQLLHYLRATGVPLGLLLHFGPAPSHHRVVNSQRRGAPGS